MDDDDLLLEDMKFDADPELEGFLSGTSAGCVNLAPVPTTLGSAAEEVPTGKIDEKATGGAADGAAGAGGAAAAAAAAGFAALTGVIMNSKLGGALPQGVVSGMVEKAVPAFAQPGVETAGKFLQKAQPWRSFFLPLSVPTAADGCSRLTANIYNFQTNYAILFVLQLGFAILFQPSALITIFITVTVWVFFLKKNEDPDWKPVIGDVQLGSMQRWLLLGSVTAIVLLFVIGGAIVNTALMYIVGAFCHGILHDPSALGTPGVGSGDDPCPI